MSNVSMQSTKQVETPISMSATPMSPNMEFGTNVSNSNMFQGATGAGGEQFVHEDECVCHEETEEEEDDELYDTNENSHGHARGHTSGNTIGGGLNVSDILALNENDLMNLGDNETP